MPISASERPAPTALCTVRLQRVAGQLEKSQQKRVMSNGARRSRVVVVGTPANLDSRPMSLPSESQILEAVPDGIVVSDLEGKIVFVNRRAEEMTGYTRAELGRHGI